MDTKIAKKRFSENQRNNKSIEKKTRFDKEPRNAVLPDEIWLKIMCHLNSKDLLITFGLVCKRFRCLSLDSKVLKVMVKNLKLKNINDKHKYTSAIKIIQNAENLNGISIELSKPYWRHLMNHALKTSDLKSLELLDQVLVQYNEKPNLTLKDITKMVETGTKLEVLKIRNLKIELEDFKLIASIKTLKSLHFVDTSTTVKKCYVFTADNIIALGRNCKYLEDISFFTIYSLSPLSNEEIHAFDVFFNERRLTLRKLRLDGFFCTDAWLNPRSSFLKNIVLCENLEELTLMNCTLSKSGEESISTLAGLKKLVNVNTYGHFIFKMDFSYLTYLVIEDTFSRREDLDKLSKIQFPALERVYINFQEYSNQGTKHFLSNCPMLKSAQFYVKEKNFGNNTNLKLESIISMIELLEIAVNSDIYLDFGSTINSSLKAVLLQHGISESQSAMIDKYYGLKINFDQWCKDNNWWMNSWSQSN